MKEKPNNDINSVGLGDIQLQKFSPSSGKQKIQGNRMTVSKKFSAFLWLENGGKERLNGFYRLVQGVGGRAKYRNRSLDLSSNHKSVVRETYTKILQSFPTIGRV